MKYRPWLAYLDDLARRLGRPVKRRMQKRNSERAIRRRHRRKGLCPKCGRKPLRKRVHCQSCLSRAAKYQQAYRDRQAVR